MKSELIEWKLRLAIQTEMLILQSRAEIGSILAKQGLDQGHDQQPLSNQKIQALKQALARARFRERAAKHRVAKLSAPRRLF